MAGWSSLVVRNLGKTNLIRSALASSKNGSSAICLNHVPARNSGHGHNFLVRTSQYRFMRLRDMGHFYLILGLIPFGAVILYCNIFIGSPKLAVIPENYVPKHWEYYEHPITRWIAKMLPSPQECYELNLHKIYVEGLKHEMMKLERKIEERMKEEEDYQAWYYVDPGVKSFRKIQEINEGLNDAKGKKYGMVT